MKLQIDSEWYIAAAGCLATFRYQYIPHSVKLIVSSRGRKSASSTDGSGSGCHDDGCKLYSSGAVV